MKHEHILYPIELPAGERHLFISLMLLCGWWILLKASLSFPFCPFFFYIVIYTERLDDASDISIQQLINHVVKIPLRLFSTLASFLLRKPPQERSSAALDTTEQEPRQHSTITFRSSLTLNGFNTGKKCGSEASDAATTSSHDDDLLTQILSEWHHAAPQFDPDAKMSLDDFELLETLGKCLG